MRNKALPQLVYSLRGLRLQDGNSLPHRHRHRVQDDWPTYRHRVLCSFPASCFLPGKRAVSFKRRPARPHVEKVLRLDGRSPGLQSPAPYCPRIGRGTRVPPKEFTHECRDFIRSPQGLSLRLCFDLANGAPASASGRSRRDEHAVCQLGDEESSWKCRCSQTVVIQSAQ